MQSSNRGGDTKEKGGAGDVTVRNGRPRDADGPAEVGRENAEVTVREWDNRAGVDVWLPGRDEALSLSWD